MTVKDILDFISKEPFRFFTKKEISEGIGISETTIAKDLKNPYARKRVVCEFHDRKYHYQIRG